jgi:arginase family enzyme
MQRLLVRVSNYFQQQRRTMSNLVPTNNSGSGSRGSRYASRALARLDARTELGIAEIESQAELQAARIMAVGYVGKRAMHEVAMISQLEQQLAELVPSCAPRLRAIGDMVALAAADVVASTVWRVQ